MRLMKPERLILAFLAVSAVACETARNNQFPPQVVPPLQRITKDIIDYSYRVGQVVRISDPDTQTPGYLLRPTATTELWELHPDLPAVFDGDLVEILDKKEIGGFYRYSVRVALLGETSRNLLGDKNYQKEGWIFSYEALGEVIGK